MFDQLFTSRSRARTLCRGPYGEMLSGFAQRLVCAGYAKTTLRRHLRAAEHLVTWATQQKLAHDCLSDALLPCFCAHLARCQCPGYGGRRHDLARGARLFLAYVSSGDLGPIKATASALPDSDLLRAFREWMHTQRGTCDATLDNYDIPLRDLLGDAGNDVSRLDAPFLRQFILARARETGPAAIRHATTAVRMFVRFLVADGRCAADLVAAVPTLAHHRLSTLPRYLHEDEVARVLTACDQRTPVGRRDYAMVLLLARLGLRAGDLPRQRGRPRATPHSLRHTFAVRALEACPDSRDAITQQMVSLSTYLGHVSVASTYWYLEATPELLRGIAECGERFITGEEP